MVAVTVLFATHNGSATLPLTLESMCKLHVPFDWELIVVDNASTDNSAEIIQAYQHRLTIRRLFEGTQGKNAALNTGLRYASGQLIVLTDDDVIPRPDWIEKLYECSLANPDFDIFGGRILPYWTKEPDPLVLECAPLGVTYALTPEEISSGPMSPGSVWGPNMAVRRRVFDAGHRFNQAIGPSGSNYVMGSETEFTTRMADNGYRCWFCGAACVQHIIRPHQLEPNWVLKRAYRNGRGWWHTHSRRDFHAPCLFGVPRWRFRSLINCYLMLGLELLRNDPSRKFSTKWQLEFLKGYISEGLRGRRSGQYLDRQQTPI